MRVRHDSNKKMCLETKNYYNSEVFTPFGNGNRVVAKNICMYWSRRGVLIQRMAWLIRGMNWLKLAEKVVVWWLLYARCMIVEGRIVENSNWNECSDLRQFSTYLCFALILNDKPLILKSSSQHLKTLGTWGVDLLLESRNGQTEDFYKGKYSRRDLEAEIPQILRILQEQVRARHV